MGHKTDSDFSFFGIEENLLSVWGVETQLLRPPFNLIFVYVKISQLTLYKARHYVFFIAVTILTRVLPHFNHFCL